VERTYTHPDVLTVGIREGWADSEKDPTQIDWTTRRAHAAIAFDVVDGRPVNPFGPTGIRYGRNELGHWGEGLAADALVTATDQDGHRWIVMVERADGRGWALPGGFVEPDEDTAAAVARELFEETGLPLGGCPGWHMSAPQYVSDPRASDEAWIVTVLGTINLDLGVGSSREHLPVVTGLSDATRAAWVNADSYDAMTLWLGSQFGGAVFPAHRDMLRNALNH
jgi:ADP-ribose pyrophosphatase YjhB (NUDIX family)